MSGPSPPQVPLEYAPGAPPRRRKRRRQMLIVLLVACVTVATWWKGPGIYHRGMVMYFLHEAKVYSAPPDQVVYEEDPAQQARLLKLPHYHLLPSGNSSWNSYVAYWVPPLDGLTKMDWTVRAAPWALFVHERRSPAGHRRLVVIWTAGNGIRPTATGATPDNQVGVMLVGTVIDGTSSNEVALQEWLAPQSVAENRTTPLYLRFYAGQPDAADPSHFTIRYQIGDYSDALDGYLEDNDNIALFPRNYRAFEQLPQEKARQRILKRKLAQ